MVYISNGTKRFSQIVDSPSFLEDVEAILEKKPEYKSIVELVNYLITNKYIRKFEITDLEPQEDGTLKFNNKKLIEIINDLLLDKKIKLTIDEKNITNSHDELFDNLDKIDNLLKKYNYRLVLVSSTQVTYIALMRDIEKQYHDNKFELQGFIEKTDDVKKVKVIYNGTESTFDYKTNIENSIPDSDIKFMLVEEVNGYKSVFVNKMIKVEIGSSYRTSYHNLWEEFKLVCSFNKDLILKGIIEDNKNIEIKIVG